MSKLTSEQCAQAVTEWCENNSGELRELYGPDLAAGEDDNWAHVGNRTNWKRRGKRKEAGNVVREFDCPPFELKAWVTTDPTDNRILSLIVSGKQKPVPTSMTPQEVLTEALRWHKYDQVGMKLFEFIEQIGWDVGHAAEQAGETEAAEFVAEELIDSTKELAREQGLKLGEDE